MVENDLTTLEQAQERMNQLLERLLEVVRNMLNAMRQRSDLEDKERQAHLELLDKKYESMQRKFQKLQVAL